MLTMGLDMNEFGLWQLARIAERPPLGVANARSVAPTASSKAFAPLVQLGARELQGTARVAANYGQCAGSRSKTPSAESCDVLLADRRHSLPCRLLAALAPN